MKKFVSLLLVAILMMGAVSAMAAKAPEVKVISWSPYVTEVQAEKKAEKDDREWHYVNIDVATLTADQEASIDVEKNGTWTLEYGTKSIKVEAKDLVVTLTADQVNGIIEAGSATLSKKY